MEEISKEVETDECQPSKNIVPAADAMEVTEFLRRKLMGFNGHKTGGL